MISIYKSLQSELILKETITNYLSLKNNVLLQRKHEVASDAEEAAQKSGVY